MIKLSEDLKYKAVKWTFIVTAIRVFACKIRKYTATEVIEIRYGSTILQTDSRLLTYIVEYTLCTVIICFALGTRSSH